MSTPEDEYDPFNGPLRGVTGRLTKLREQLDWVQDKDVEDTIATLTFATGMLVDLVEQLARKLSTLLPTEEEE